MVGLFISFKKIVIASEDGDSFLFVIYPLNSLFLFIVFPFRSCSAWYIVGTSLVQFFSNKTIPTISALVITPTQKQS
jgi:hypothetical protein